MERNRYLDEAIETNNLIRIRTTFSVIAHEDSSFSTGKFMDTLAYVKGKNIPDLFQPYDGIPFAEEQDWSADYWSLAVSSLMDNFCQERIDHLRAVSSKVYPPRVSAQSSGGTKHSTFHRVEEKTPKKATPIATVATAAAITCVVSLAVGAKGLALGTGIVALVTVPMLLKKD